jgi:hypothetical protein
MTDYRKVLCVGGTHDGERLKTEPYRRTIELPDPLPTQLTPPEPLPIDEVSPATPRSTHVIEPYRAGSLTLWLGPPDQTSKRTLQLLVDGYHR